MIHNITAVYTIYLLINSYDNWKLNRKLYFNVIPLLNWNWYDNIDRIYI